MGSLIRYLKNHHSDLNLVARAIRGNWPISEDQREEAVRLAMKCARSDNEMVQVRALRVLQLMLQGDRQYEVQILQLIASDQLQPQFMFTTSSDDEADDPVAKELESSAPEGIHQYLLMRSQDEETNDDPA